MHAIDPPLLFFCSAKMLVQGEPNIAYICSRYYRAPELIFGATDYTPAIGKHLSAIARSAVLEFERSVVQICGHQAV